MSIETRCRTIQLLEPDPTPDYEVLDSTSLAVNEGGALYLPTGVTEVPILFTTEKLSADYDITEHDISNDVDLDPLVIDYNFTDRTTSGFTLVLDSMADTTSYIFRYRVIVSTLS